MLTDAPPRKGSRVEFLDSHILAARCSPKSNFCPIATSFTKNDRISFLPDTHPSVTTVKDGMGS